MKKWFEDQRNLFYCFLFVLIVPNILLCITEQMSVGAKLTNILLPLGCYYTLMTLSRSSAKMVGYLFLFVFLGAFQIVLLYLFGKSVIAVDMFLNLVTTNSAEAFELLDNLIPALVVVFLLYIPIIVWGIISVVHKRTVSEDFLRRQRKKSVLGLFLGVLALLLTVWTDEQYEFKSDFYPVNVCYNAYLAVQREIKTESYDQTSKDFSFHAYSSHAEEEREIYVMVVGETSRALNWKLYGYDRDTNPLLSVTDGLVAFPKVLTESNTTHKSVPMLLSDICAENFDSIYFRKGILTAFKEAGFHTAFFSNQRYNNSFIDFFGKEAENSYFIKEKESCLNPGDEDLLLLLEKELKKKQRKLFVVLHTYGSHFSYKERYPSDFAYFKPDSPLDVSVKYRENLKNAYDNTIRYTDYFLFRLMSLLKQEQAQTAFVYTSDHGEDLYDDDRRLFLHASPIPSAYQIYVPFVVWTSDEYQTAYSDKVQALEANRLKNISSSSSLFHTMLDLAGVETVYRKENCSVASQNFVESPRVYLNDHNEARSLKDMKMDDEDFRLLKKWNIDY